MTYVVMYCFSLLDIKINPKKYESYLSSLSSILALAADKKKKAL